MIYTKANPVGIDRPIQRIQNKLFSKLCTTWGLNSDTYNCFGRVYRNQDVNGQYTPQAYSGEQNVEYDDNVLYNDLVSCTSFFGVDSTREFLGGNTYKVSCFLIFSLDISKIKPSIPWRADEEIHLDALRVLKFAMSGDTITGLTTELDKILKEYNGYKANKGVIHTDLQPKHWFRIDFDLTYINNNC